MIVSSHMKYAKPLSKLLSSFRGEKFTEWQRVVVVRAGATDCRIHTVTYDETHTLTTIDTTLNAYELTSFAEVYKHYHHEKIRAESYFFMHDTCVVNAGFPSALDGLHVEPGEVVMTHMPSSNIALIHKDVLLAIKDKFDVKLTKWEAVQVEIKGGIQTFGKSVRYLGHRQELPPMIDVYDTGVKRVQTIYPCFQITKFFYRGSSGDVTGEIEVIRDPNGTAQLWNYQVFQHG